MVELGSGGGAFHTVTEGAPVQTVIGPQGSPMMVLAVRAGGIAPGDPENPSERDPSVHVVCKDASDQVMAQGDNRRGMTPTDEPGVFELAEIWTPLYTGQQGGRLLLRCTATLTDSAGVTATDTRSVAAVW
jgi:hypothetical protein